MSARVVVIGGSVAGLASALFLARRGVSVTVVDQDPEAAAEPPVDGARRATPQAAHSHIFLSRLRLLLEERAPEVLDALRDSGTHEIAMADGRPPTLSGADLPRGDELVALAVRRSTFEDAVRSVVARTPGIELVIGTAVTGLAFAPASDLVPLRVDGVVLADGRTLRANIVIDASGRRTSVPGWLAEAGVELPTEVVPCGISYVSRFYERRPGATPPRLTRGFTTGSSFDRYSCLVFPGDGRTFSVTFGILPEDKPLRGLADPGSFGAAVSAIPSLAWWVQPHNAVPTSDPRLMNGLKNRLRRHVVDGRPLVLGLAAIGDAVSTTNPAHSRGTTLAFVQAASVADAAIRSGVVDCSMDVDGLTAFARRVDRAVDQNLLPWFEDSIGQDAARLSRWRPDEDPGDRLPVSSPDRVTNGEAIGASAFDPEVWARFARLQNLLDVPADVLADPVFVQRVRAVQASGASAPPAAAPSHDELVALIDAHRSAQRRSVARPPARPADGDAPVAWAS